MAIYADEKGKSPRFVGSLIFCFRKFILTVIFIAIFN